jgi:hypothetical protein
MTITKPILQSARPVHNLSALSAACGGVKRVEIGGKDWVFWD